MFLKACSNMGTYSSVESLVFFGFHLCLVRANAQAELRGLKNSRRAAVSFSL